MIITRFMNGQGTYMEYHHLTNITEVLVGRKSFLKQVPTSESSGAVSYYYNKMNTLVSNVGWTVNTYYYDTGIVVLYIIH